MTEDELLESIPRPTPNEGKLLLVLWRADGKWVTVDQILSMVWPDWYAAMGEVTTGQRKNVQVHICRLRQRLQGTEWSIETWRYWDRYRLLHASAEAKVA